MMRPSEHRRGRLLLEMAVIVFSVLFALVVNEWRQGVARAATVETVLGTVWREAETNRGEVARALDHHRDLLAQLRAGGIIMGRVDLNTVPLDTTSAVRLARTATDLVRAEARQTGRRPPSPFRARRLPDGRWELSSAEGTLLVEIHGDTALVRGSGNIVLGPPFLLDSAWETAQATQAAVHMDPEIVAAMAAVRQLQRRVDGTVNRIADFLYSTGEGADMISALADLAGFEAALLEAYDHLLGLRPRAAAP
jgi:hypothetical protein